MSRYFIESAIAGVLGTGTYLMLLYPFDVLRVRVGTDVGYK